MSAQGWLRFPTIDGRSFYVRPDGSNTLKAVEAGFNRYYIGPQGVYGKDGAGVASFIGPDGRRHDFNPFTD